MTTPLHYEYSTTYLATHMSRLSRGFVILGLAAIAWVVAIGLISLVINAFN